MPPPAYPPGRKAVPDLQRVSRAGQKLVFIATYDAPFARMADHAGVDGILIGDSLGMVFQGHDTTLPVTLDEIIYHCRAVLRGSERAHLVGDLPFMSYQASPADGLRSAGRLLKEGHVQSVKLEGGVRAAETIRRMVEAGIPVMGHVGLTPQSVHTLGGFRVQGQDDDGAKRIFEDALAVEEAGAYAVVLEGIPEDLAGAISARLAIPTVGIGAGAACGGQVLVHHDLLGLIPGFQPKFAKRFANLWESGTRATEAFCREVREGSFPGSAHAFARRPREAAQSFAASPPGSSEDTGTASSAGGTDAALAEPEASRPGASLSAIARRACGDRSR